MVFWRTFRDLVKNQKQALSPWQSALVLFSCSLKKIFTGTCWAVKSESWLIKFKAFVFRIRVLFSSWSHFVLYDEYARKTTVNKLYFQCISFCTRISLVHVYPLFESFFLCICYVNKLVSVHHFIHCVICHKKCYPICLFFYNIIKKEHKYIFPQYCYSVYTKSRSDLFGWVSDFCQRDLNWPKHSFIPFIIQDLSIHCISKPNIIPDPSCNCPVLNSLLYSIILFTALVQ